MTDPAADGMVHVQIRGGRVLVDSGDRIKIIPYKWTAKKYRNTSYAVAYKYVGNYRSEIIYMHRLLSRANKGELVDHVNGDGLDNRMSNLRICTNRQNQQNQKTIKGISRFKGVSWDSSRSKWMAQIVVNGKNKYLGRFGSEDLAAEAYATAAKEFFNDFASTNFVMP